MPELKHTPGPWNRYGAASRFITFEETENSAKDCELFPQQYKNREEFHANAKLIAAAPDLLEALNRFVAFADQIDQTRNDGFESSMILQAKAAIAKATT